MKNIFFFFFISLWWSFVQAADYALIGYIPGEYLGRNKSKVFLGYVSVKGKVIHKVGELSEAQERALQAGVFPQFENQETLVFRRGDDYDVIYPGFIDLHNHASRNMFPAWEGAHGQFGNRYDWRNNRDYKLAVASNSGPWLRAENALSCAAFRWNELQSMTLGTTYLQGHRNCSEDFAIHQAEKTTVYGSDKKKVSAPADLFSPNTILYIWKDLKPYMEEQSLSFAPALANQLNDICSDGESFSIESLFDPEVVKSKISNMEWLKSHCALSENVWENKSCRPRKDSEWMNENKEERRLRYLLCGHANIAKRKRYLDDPKSSAFIFHLAEGRRDDAYNQTEFKILKLLGFDRPHVGLVHGLGLSQADYTHMADKGMGLIWSPYSNFLLYGESLDFSKLNKKLSIAIGSDWTPTGTKSILEEVKIARNYLLKEGYSAIFNDEDLYHMMTSNPAKIINAEGLIGTLKPGAMASLIVTSKKTENPYTNIVRDVKAEDINLVLVDGEVIYGNESYIQQADYRVGEYEEMPQYIGKGMEDWVQVHPQLPAGYSYKFEDLPVPPAQLSRATSLEKWAYNVELALWVDNHRQDFEVTTPTSSNSHCEFDEVKAFVKKPSTQSLSSANQAFSVLGFKQETNIDLNSYMDIQMILAVALMTQNGNIHDSQWGDIKSRMTYFPSLYTCNDKRSFERQRNFIPLGVDGEYSKNKAMANKERPVSDPLCKVFSVCSDD